MYDILVVGGGASGMAAAIAACQEREGISVAVIEKNNRVGKKILVTGNGRCNITNTNIDISRYHGDCVKFAMTALADVNVEQTLQFFENLGMYPKIEGSKVYPNSLQASSVVDMLRMKMAQLGIAEICDFDCVDIHHSEGNFTLYAKSGATIKSKRVIVCTGGKAAPKCGTDGQGYKLLQKFGHELTNVYPSLVQIRCHSPYLVAMKGVKLDANVSICANGKVIKTEFGELLFTDYGISGPPVFQLSRIASVECDKNSDVYALIDMLPEINEEEVYIRLCTRNKNVPIDEFLTGMFNKLCARQLLKSCGVNKFNTDAHVLTDDILKLLAKNIKSWRFDITGTNSWDAAQVTAGGIKTDMFNPSTMQSELVDGLYAAGEILDIDGDCGGFNLQWAWSSGITAGENCARSLK